MPTDPRNDLELVSAINGGDDSAFESLYYRHRNWVLRLARRFTGNDADALDVTQETFVYLSSKFPGFRLTSRMTTFLWRVVRNLSLQARRKSQMSLAIDDAALDLPAKAQATFGELIDVISVLRPDHRKVILMRFVDDLSIEEIAELLGVPSGTVKSRLHHAIAQLRESPSVRRYFDLD